MREMILRCRAGAGPGAACSGAARLGRPETPVEWRFPGMASGDAHSMRPAGHLFLETMRPCHQ